MTREEWNRHSRERYWWYRERGLCPKCGTRYAEAGHAYCKACAMDYSRMRKKADPTGELRREKDRAKRERRRAEGMCYDCGAPAHGKSRCPRCMERSRQRRHVWAIRHGKK